MTRTRTPRPSRLRAGYANGRIVGAVATIVVAGYFGIAHLTHAHDSPANDQLLQSRISQALNVASQQVTNADLTYGNGTPDYTNLDAASLNQALLAGKVYLLPEDSAATMTLGWATTSNYCLQAQLHSHGERVTGYITGDGATGSGTCPAAPDTASVAG